MTTATVTILMAPRTPYQNRFVDQLVAAIPEGLTVVGFTWRKALLSRYDVLHLHWPETLFKDSRPGHGVVKRVLVTILLLRLAALGTPVVWTVHNPLPHEHLSRIDARLYRALTSRVVHHVVLNEADRGRYESATVIPHGHYRDLYPAMPLPMADTRRGRFTLLSFGLIRPYKGLDALIIAFRDSGLSGVRLRIVGLAVDEGYLESLRALAHGVPNIEFDPRHVEHDEVGHVLGSADLVVLPYRRLTNSGVLLLALSVGRPVLAPNVGACSEVQAQVGEDWVMLFNGELTGDKLRNAVASTEAQHVRSPPDLSHFDWQAIGRAYATVFRAVTR